VLPPPVASGVTTGGGTVVVGEGTVVEVELDSLFDILFLYHFFFFWWQKLL
jgi:hypothetical protein